MADDFPSSKVFYTEGNQNTKPSHLQLQNDGSSTRNCPSLSLPWSRIIRRYELGSSYIQSNIKGQQDIRIPTEKLKQVPASHSYDPTLSTLLRYGTHTDSATSTRSEWYKEEPSVLWHQTIVRNQELSLTSYRTLVGQHLKHADQEPGSYYYIQDNTWRSSSKHPGLHHEIFSTN